MSKLRVGFVGDVVGRNGREMVSKCLSEIRRDYSLDFVVLNGENASHGFGITLKNYEELLSSGVDVVTGGNHSFDKREIYGLLEENNRLLRPANYPEETMGKGVFVDEKNSIAVINLIGHFTMGMHTANCFNFAKKEVSDLKSRGIKHIFMDFHAESTSEKIAMLELLKGEVSAIVGTHTHVGTDDLQINGDTLFVSDIGMSGARDGVIGVDTKAVLDRFTMGLPSRFDVVDSKKRIFQIVVAEFRAGKCVEAKKIKILDDERTFVNEAYIF